MSKLVCTLDCRHSIEWGETVETPGASLPHVSMIAYCAECATDSEIVDIDPQYVIVETIKVRDNASSRNNSVSVLYDTISGTWGHFSAGRANGLLWESENTVGYESQAEAREAALAAAAEDAKASAEE